MTDIPAAQGLAAAYLVVEITKYLVVHLKPKKEECLTAEERTKLAQLYDMHNVRDVDGRPVWYFPGSVHDNQKETLAILREIANSQRETAKIMERILTKMERES